MRKNKKITACLLLLIHGASVFTPGISYALTSGPTAPETSQFQPASITNLVDPFSGDFSYNIPLLDVDGYPINLAYNSGGGMDDEASWVGSGWNINPGSINRTMKGIPDDFNGTDKIKKEYNITSDVTAGVTFNVSGEVFGLDFLGANGSCDIFYNNKRGLGVEIGAGISATLNTAKHSSGEFTTGLAAGGNLGITSNSQTGADFNFGANMGISVKDKEGHCGALGLRFGGGLNSRAGLKSTTLGASFNTSKAESKDHERLRTIFNGLFRTKFKAPKEQSVSSMSLGSSTTNYGMAFTPTITMAMVNESYSLSPQTGAEFWGFEAPNLQLTGHYAKQKLARPVQSFPAYGFLHSAEGRKNKFALLDFNREKDAPYTENSPTLSVPYITQDVFTATSHLGSSQFKAFTNSTGIFFDSYNTNSSNAFSLGVEFGGGAGTKGGGDFSGSGSSTVTQKWVTNNDFLTHGDFKQTTAVDGEDAYFKLVGEKSSINKDYLNKIIDKTPVKVQTANVDDQARAFSKLASNKNTYDVNSAIAKNKREARGELFTPLTAAEAQKYALDKQINNYAPITINQGFECNNGVFGNISPINRVSETHKAHHLSEIKVTKNDGMRLVYGTPVYNNEQVDITMSVNNSPYENNLVKYNADDASIKNSNGLDHYFSKETIPSYATSYLLTGICSPDYIDITGNGISDDDLGSAVKFNYSLVNQNYRWRTPNGRAGEEYLANFSEGFRCKADDNKASFSYGNKELWYTHSIESKNMVAVFRTSDRDDGFGYMPDGRIDGNSRLKKLDQIDLYTKTELLTNPSNPTPIKSVHFDYNYILYSNLPNNLNGKGKLTLTSVYFTYANSKSGKENKYYFKYKNEGENFEYQYYDRWGNYKDKTWNKDYSGVELDNNEFPYTIQNNPDIAREAAGKWLLNEIELPSGGKIKVEYESDDYAFVQNRRAMEMAPIVGYGSYDNYTNFQRTNKIYIKLPYKTTRKKLKREYFEDIDQLSFKARINLVNKNVDNSSLPTDELVSGFAKVVSVSLKNEADDNEIADENDDTEQSDVAIVTLENRGEYHPIVAAAWQFLRLNLSDFAHPYKVNLEQGPLAVIKALVTAIGNVGELLTPFESRAMRKGFASSAVKGKGFVRICTSLATHDFRNSNGETENKYGGKYGGGVRVKRIKMNDIWGDMVGNDNGRTTETGMEFDYTREYTFADGTKQPISSGVASYEPMSGADENPFKLPINYQQKAHLTSNVFTVEEPLGESYMPAPSVGYSQVTIRNLDAEGAVVKNGYSLKRFYTAKDFPTLVKRTDLSKNKYNQSSIFGLFNVDQGNSVVLSQGFYVETNDMHGKPLSDETFDGSGKLLSGSYYHYKSSGTEELSLDNHVLTLHPDGSVKDEIVGQEFEMYTDMREQITDNIGVTMNLNLDILFFAIIVVPIPTFIPIVQNSHCGYEAASTIKVVNKYAITDKVTTIDNGSTMISENILWDALTGQVLLTKTQNGFDDPLYNFSLPAYMVNQYEKGMGAAYKNTGIIFKDALVSNGECNSIDDYLVPGDELGVMDDNSPTPVVVWATDISPEAYGPHTPVIRLMKKDGSLFTGNNTLMLLRSGRRNVMSASAFTVVSLKSPIKNGMITTNTETEILNASASTFNDEWTAEVRNTSCINNFPDGGRPGNSGSSQQKPINNLKEPISVSELIKRQAVGKSQQSALKPVSINEPVKKSSNGEAAKNGSTTTECSACSPEYYELVHDGPDTDEKCWTIKWLCPDNAFPIDKKAFITVKAECEGGYQMQTAVIDHDNLRARICFDLATDRCKQANIVEVYCEEIRDDCNTCSDLEAFRFSNRVTDDLYCTAVRFKCIPTNIPIDKRIVFTYMYECKDMPPVYKTAIIDRNHLSAEVCFDKSDPACFGAKEPKLVSWYCETVACLPCDPASYDIVKRAGEDCNGFSVSATYGCHVPFPPGTSAILSFSLVCRGIACQTKLITIDNSTLTGEICFDTDNNGPACEDCHNYTVDNIQFNGIIGTACDPTPDCCPPPVDKAINPYYTGLKGNWRAKQNYVYITKRDARANSDINHAKQPTDTRKGGIYKDFSPFYYASNLSGEKTFVSVAKNENNVGHDDESKIVVPGNKWIAPATVKKINSKGMEVENKDALDKYSSAQFGFNDLLATAVAGNARNNEIGYDGFEDYAYTNACGGNANANLCNEAGHFNFHQALKDNAQYVKLTKDKKYEEDGLTVLSEAHTGNYSVFVKGGAKYAANTERQLNHDFTGTYKTDGTNKYSIGSNGQFILKQGGILPPLKPWTGKKYMISGWIKGDVMLSTTEPESEKFAKIIVEGWNYVNGSTLPFYKATAIKAGPKVEGWTRVQATFEIPERSTSDPDYLQDYVRITLWPGDKDAYFDDVRIYPYDANMKTFAYDYKTTRLMAELDENNYATFYEYNDEGQLLRNKKETEKGIATIRETRDRVRKNGDAD